MPVSKLVDIWTLSRGISGIKDDDGLLRPSTEIDKLSWLCHLARGPQEPPVATFGLVQSAAIYKHYFDIVNMIISNDIFNIDIINELLRSCLSHTLRLNDNILILLLENGGDLSFVNKNEKYLKYKKKVITECLKRHGIYEKYEGQLNQIKDPKNRFGKLK